MKKKKLLPVLLIIFSLLIFSCSDNTGPGDDNPTENWDIIIDNGIGNGTWLLELMPDSTIISTGSWIFDYGGNAEVNCDFVSATFTFNNIDFSFDADGTAHHSGINQESGFTLTVSGTMCNGEGNGEYEIDFAQNEWESLSGNWSGLLIQGEGVTPIYNKFLELLNYMDNNGMSIDNLLDDYIISAVEFVDNLDDYSIIDIRNSDINENGIPDYYDGHIPGAMPSSLANIIEDAHYFAFNPIIVVSYTGQRAGYATMALRLSGYSDAKVMKWGMSGWHSDFDLWSQNCAQLNHANWILPPGEIKENEEFDYPTIDTNEYNGCVILIERINALLIGGFQGLSQIEVLDNTNDYFINNFWEEDDITTYGNILNSYRIKPLIIENLNPNNTIVTCSWSGQASSMITAYLAILGYDAKNLQFGVNSIIYDDLINQKWLGSADYDYETTAQ